MRTRSFTPPQTYQVSQSGGTDPGLRSSPGVTILNSAVPQPAGQESGDSQPPHPAARAPGRTFSSLYCEKFHCPPEKFEEEVLWRCLQPRSALIARLLWKWVPDFYQPDFDLISEIKDLTAVDDLSSEIGVVRYHQPVRGMIRGRLRVRVSGQRLVDLGDELFKSAE